MIFNFQFVFEIEKHKNSDFCFFNLKSKIDWHDATRIVQTFFTSSGPLTVHEVILIAIPSAFRLLSLNFVHVFGADLENSEITVVYHSQGLNGWSTVCANGKQNLPKESVGNYVRD